MLLADRPILAGDPECNTEHDGIEPEKGGEQAAEQIKAGIDAMVGVIDTQIDGINAIIRDLINSSMR